MTARVLVTGAAGFIGRWSVPPLLARGYEVHGAVHSTAGAASGPLRGAELHAVDLLDAAAVESLLAALRPTHLLHFAWIATPGVYWNSPENTRWLVASQRLLRAFHAAGGARAVMAGTCAEYDWSGSGVCVEGHSALADEGAGRITPYAQSKLSMQKALESFGDLNDLSTAWGRAFFQYGPGEHPDRLVASVIRSLLSGREALCSHGNQIRGFLHVADVGSAFAALLDSRVEGPVNIGSDERIRIAEVLGRISLQIGRPDLVRLGARAAPADEPALLVADATRLREEVGWQPHFSLHDGLADTIDWWRRELEGHGAAGGS